LVKEISLYYDARSKKLQNIIKLSNFLNILVIGYIAYLRKLFSFVTNQRNLIISKAVKKICIF